MYWALLVNQSIREQKQLPDTFHLSKNEIAQNHQLPEERSPHRAMNGVEHLILCYQKVVGFTSFSE
jgi:DNA polymerase-3 subunit epsilon/oligoribonuclease